MSNFFGFKLIDHTARIACFDSAKFTAAGTRISQEHEGSGAARPAFADVGAASFFANRVKIKLSEVGFYLEIILSTGRANFEPLWLWF